MFEPSAGVEQEEKNDHMRRVQKGPEGMNLLQQVSGWSPVQGERKVVSATVLPWPAFPTARVSNQHGREICICQIQGVHGALGSNFFLQSHGHLQR